MLEYVVVLALIAVVVIAVVTVVGQRTTSATCGVSRGLRGGPPATGANYATAVLGDSPAAYYRLGEGSGATAADSSPARSAGVYTGGYTLGAAGALSRDNDTAASFDGSTGYMLGAAPGVNATNSALEVWANITVPEHGAFIHVGGGNRNGPRHRIDLL